MWHLGVQRRGQRLRLNRRAFGRDRVNRRAFGRDRRFGVKRRVLGVKRCVLGRD